MPDDVRCSGKLEIKTRRYVRVPKDIHMEFTGASKYTMIRIALTLPQVGRFRRRFVLPLHFDPRMQEAGFIC